MPFTYLGVFSIPDGLKEVIFITKLDYNYQLLLMFLVLAVILLGLGALGALLMFFTAFM